MKRKTKNIIMIILFLMLLGVMAFAMHYVKQHITIKDFNVQNESMETPPDISNENTLPDMPSDDFNEGNRQPEMSQMRHEFQFRTSVIYYLVLGVPSILISGLLIYLFMSRLNKKTLKETLYSKDKWVIIILLTIILTTGFLIGSISFIHRDESFVILNDESSEKEEVLLDQSNIISSTQINLDEQNTDVTISSSGKYTFTGTFSHSIIIDAENEDVELILDNVTIENVETATIIGLNANKITINLNDGTINTLTDGGNSEYDGCIFSNAELIFTGTGKLIVNGNQNEGEGIASEAKDITFNGGTYIITSNDDGINAGGDGATITFNEGTFYIDASGDGIDSNKNIIINGGTIFVMGSDVGADAGIDTDEGFTINGGTVIALGSDMIETPLETSKQKSIAFSLNNSITKDTIVTLMKDNKELISFQASKSFKTIIISFEELENGTYELYINGSNTGDLINGIYQNSNYTKGDKLTINGETNFEVTKSINLYKESR